MPHPPLLRLPLAAALAVGLSTAAMAQPLERARAAQARGDLRTAQIELRNAVRDDPRSAAARAALASASLELGDGTTAEKEARTAIELGFDPVAGTALLMRAMLVTGRNAELLREYPVPPGPPAVAGQVAAARALAQLSLERPDLTAASASVDEALRLAPDAAEPHLAAAALAGAQGDRQKSEAETDRTLAINPNLAEGLLRKGSLLQARGAGREAADTFGRLIAQAPGNVAARLRRAEVMMALGDDAAARQDVDAALTTVPGNAPGVYARATLLARAGDWRAADEDLQRLGSAIANFPEGFLLQALTRRALGQSAGAEDAAQRYVARRPDDPRGAKVLAAIELASGRAGAAAATLGRLVAREGVQPDAETFDMLGQAEAGAGRPREAAQALARADALAPGNRDILNRLAAARLAAGDAAGASDAAGRSLQIDSAQPAVREMMATAALVRGDTAGAEAELGRIGAGERGEASGVTEGLLRLNKLDLPGARAAFTAVLKDRPDSTSARLGLIRVARAEGSPGAAEEIERLLVEVLRRDPTNAEALSTLSATARPGAPRAASARAALEAVQAAAPNEILPALTLADLLIRSNEAPRAVSLLETPALRTRGGTAVAMARTEALAAAGRWDEAREVARTALAEDPASVQARVQLSLLTARNGDQRAAEGVLQEGLRTAPGNAALQQALVSLVLRGRGLDAALASADRLATQSGTMPAAAVLRGDLIATTGKMDDAAKAYAEAYGRAPSSALAQRRAAALQRGGKPAEAASALREWLGRTPDDVPALAMLAGLDIAAGRLAEAEAGLNRVVAQAPNDSTSLNNLAWVVDRRGNSARARDLAQRAYSLSANVETADTLGWILARNGDARTGAALLRESLAAREAGGRADPAASWRLAYALRADGKRDEALRVLTPALANGAPFPERAEAERLLNDLRAGR